MRRKLTALIAAALLATGIAASTADAHWQGRNVTGDGNWKQIHSTITGCCPTPAYILSFGSGTPANWRVGLYNSFYGWIYESGVHYWPGIGVQVTDGTGLHTSYCALSACSIWVVSSPGSGQGWYVNDQGDF